MTAPTEPLKLTPPWAYYRRTGLSEMRPYIPREPLAAISVSAPDMDTITRALIEGRDPGGYVARNPKNHADKWYVTQTYFDEHLEPADTPARDDAAELRAEVEGYRNTAQNLARAVTALQDENAELRAALVELVRLKNGPRDDAYYHDREHAWAAARAALAATEGEA